MDKKAICPECNKVRIKWDWCQDEYKLYSLEDTYLNRAATEEVVLFGRLLTLNTCNCGCIISINVDTDDDIAYQLNHEALQDIDWEEDENSHNPC